MFEKMKRTFGEQSKAVYKSDKKREIPKDRTMLLVSHTMERGGAPLVLLELVDFFQKNYNVIFISMEDGGLRDEFLNKGLDIYIGSSLVYAGMKEEIWNSFDCVFLNTILSYSFLPYFQNRKCPVIWWLHEPELMIRRNFGRGIHFAQLSKNVTICSVTRETEEAVEKYYGVKTKILHMGLQDKYVGDRVRKDGKVRFFMPAKFQAIKGQDIAAQAILGMPTEYRERAEFIFAGARDEKQPEYYELISKLAVAIPQVIMLGEISKEEVYEWYQNVDCVIAPSRADATPTTIVEGMMFRKVCTCSANAGISKYIEDNKSGFIFAAEDVSALKETLMYIIEQYDELSDLRDAGRAIYLRCFEQNRVIELVRELLNTGDEINE